MAEKLPTDITIEGIAQAVNSKNFQEKAQEFSLDGFGNFRIDYYDGSATDKAEDRISLTDGEKVLFENERGPGADGGSVYDVLIGKKERE